jgi:signal transduction histidine kinase
VVVLGLSRSERDAPVTSIADVLDGRHARLRVVAGASLLVVGLLVLGTGDRVSATVRIGLFAAALSTAGVALLLGPWIARLTRAANDERRQRIRAEEREAMAAHLHDSVLQTLALIQRTADDPRRTASLARQQEHDLRAWLFGVEEQPADSLASSVRSMAREIEQRHDVRVDVVVVGDSPMDDALMAMVAALREACVNAAKHSGVDNFALYVETVEGQIDAWVRDRGCGFAPSDTHEGHGISQSIQSRVERAGGHVNIISAPGSGTEVHLSVPRIPRMSSEVAG